MREEEKEFYLWDRNGEPDLDVARMERLLMPLRYRPQTLVIPEQRSFTSRRWILWLTPVIGAAAVILLFVAFSYWRLNWNTDNPWPVQVLVGQPSIGGLALERSGRLGVGQVLQTDGVSRAELRVARIGSVEVEPNTQLELVATHTRRHQIALKQGKISAHIWAPPWSLSMDTPSATVFDLGCAFTLEVVPDGAGSVRVTSGWVQLESEGFQSVVPAGAQADTRRGFAPGSPYFAEATPEFKRALQILNFGRPDAEEQEGALRIVLSQARVRDVLTLFNLFHRSTGEQRGEIYDRAAQLAPPPTGVTRDGIVNANQKMLDEWWNSLGYRNAKTWWINWKDGRLF